MSSLVLAILKDRAKYDPDTGNFICTRQVSGSKARPGDVLGTRAVNGYLYIRLAGTLYSCHRLAVLWMTGSWPTLDIDHINGNTTDNSWKNLRVVSNCVNLRNTKRHRNNPSTGVHYDKVLGKWKAYVTVNRIRKHLGVFLTKEEAITARQNFNSQNLHLGYCVFGQAMSV